MIEFDLRNAAGSVCPRYDSRGLRLALRNALEGMKAA